MNSDIPQSPAGRAGHPIVGMLTSFPIVCFTGALLTDIAYVQTTNVMWTNFSAWLLAVGMAAGVMAAIVGLIVWIAGRLGRTPRSAWTFTLGGLLTLVIAFVNNLVHSRDGWTSVMPTGLALSVATVVVMLATAWLASGRRHRRAVAMSSPGVRGR